MDNRKINIDDEVLVQRAQRGESSAMEVLITRYQNRIYNVILKICGNREDAADLSQEAFVKAMQNLDSFQLRSSFYTWLFRIAVNLTINYCKRNVRLGYRSLDSGGDESDLEATGRLKDILADSQSIDPAKALESKELRGLIIKAIMKLDEDQRAVVVLRDIEAMSYSQIAETLEVGLGTVKSRISRGRNNVREFLEAMLP
ncbi:MAG: sigma-70 family RNA polymerase sigma factor [Phycisphaerae bacterium]|nr:sigma-70 family RNA polymerase sigma factor [Phycisphaerae bacterium]